MNDWKKLFSESTFAYCKKALAVKGPFTQLGKLNSLAIYWYQSYFPKTTVVGEKADLSFRIPAKGMIPEHLHQTLFDAFCHNHGFFLNFLILNETSGISGLYIPCPLSNS